MSKKYHANRCFANNGPDYFTVTEGPGFGGYVMAQASTMADAEQIAHALNIAPAVPLMRDALDALRKARSESSQAFNRVSYYAPVQPVFEMLEREEKMKEEARNG